MSKLTIVPLVALLTTTACAVDLSGDGDGAGTPPDAGKPTSASVDCQTAVPDPDAFAGRPMVFGIVPTEQDGHDPQEAFIKLDARVAVDADALTFSMDLQPLDAASEEPVGETQRIEGVPIDDEGLFVLDDLVLRLPADAMESTAAEQTALVSATGGFCVETGSLQGSYEGWTFSPTSAETRGVWFAAPETE